MKKVIFCIVIFSYVYTQAYCQCHIDDWTALKALYESTGGDNWEKKEGWEQIKGETPPTDCDLSSIHGVNAMDEYGNRIEELFLPSNNLIGSIPNDVCNLSALKEFSLDLNRLNGVIPNCIGQLTELTFLGLDFNQLSGSIPSEVGNLCNLRWLALIGNQLTGEIPPELGKLKNISRIELSNNQLSGGIPPELAIESSLITYVLALNGNELTGSIPPEFGDIPFDSFTLFLWDNNLSGCYDVNLLKICDNFYDPYGFASPVDDDKFDATWREFCFEGKGICDTVNRCHLTDWQALQNIYQNYGGVNWLTTAGWDSLIVNQDTIPSNCNLDDLYGVSTNSTGQVDSIDLSGNGLTGNFTSDWANLDSLIYLNIADNNFSGCFDSLTVELCGQLNSPYFVADSLIDAGNNFDSTWEFFCTYQTCDTTSTSVLDFTIHQPLNIFPNPAKKFVHIKNDALLLGAELDYQIIGIKGQLLKKSNIKKEKINVTLLKTGTYFLIIRDGKQVYSSRFVKI